MQGVFAGGTCRSPEQRTKNRARDLGSSDGRALYSPEISSRDPMSCADGLSRSVWSSTGRGKASKPRSVSFPEL